MVMIPKHPAFAPQYSQGLYDIYGPAVEQRFYLAPNQTGFAFTSEIDSWFGSLNCW